MNDSAGRVEIEAGDTPIRAVNAAIREAVAAGDKVLVRRPLSRHNLGVALPDGADVVFDGSVGYYCGGLNDGATITVTRNAGWGTGEAMASGHITVDGYCGMSAGASMRGGLIHVRGDAGPRCGVAMKGGDIVVEGHVGYLTGFMSHAGRIVALGGAEDACGDSLWGGEVWVAGNVGSLGVDAKIVDPAPGEVAGVSELLARVGIDGSWDWKKIVSAQRLWHFESRDAGAWLMI
ncbi:GXGXG domain-containing protein [soil metagenome]